MKKGLTLATAACATLLSLTLCGCATQAEEPTVPTDAPSSSTSNSSSNASFALTDSAALKSLAIGQSAVWKDYEVTLDSIERSGGMLTAHIEISSHGSSQTLSTECLLSFGMAPVRSSFDNEVIKVGAGESVSGTLTFDDRFESQRLFWNDGATEATWQLDLDPVGSAETQAPANGASEKPTEEAKPPVNPAQTQAIAALEAEIPSLFTNNTSYEYSSVNSATALVTPRDDGGYEYINDVAILDGAGNPSTAHVRLICEPNGNCISMTVDEVFLF